MGEATRVLDNFIKDNAKWLLFLLFTAGITYSEFSALKRQVEGYKVSTADLKEALSEQRKDIYKMHYESVSKVKEQLEHDLNVVETRLNKKIQVINEHEDEIHEINVDLTEIQTQLKYLHK